MFIAARRSANLRVLRILAPLPLSLLHGPLPVVTLLACALSVAQTPIATVAQRLDVVGDGAGRQAFAEVRDAAERIAIENHRSPSLVTSPVAAARRGSSFAIA